MRLLAPFQGRRITTTTTAHTRDTWEEFFFWAVYIFVFKKIIRRSQKDRANEWMEEEEKENKDWCEERERLLHDSLYCVRSRSGGDERTNDDDGERTSSSIPGPEYSLTYFCGFCLRVELRRRNGDVGLSASMRTRSGSLPHIDPSSSSSETERNEGPSPRRCR